MEGHPSAQGEDQVTIHASSQPISPLRRRMLDDMAMRGMREATQRDYIRFDRNRCGGGTYRFCARVEMMSSVAD
jgi:hypothetical protein